LRFAIPYPKHSLHAPMQASLAWTNGLEINDELFSTIFVISISNYAIWSTNAKPAVSEITNSSLLNIVNVILLLF